MNPIVIEFIKQEIKVLLSQPFNAYDDGRLCGMIHVLFLLNAISIDEHLELIDQRMRVIAPDIAA